MLLPMAQPSIIYRLTGASLETAKEIHLATKEANKSYDEIQKQIAEYAHNLLVPFNEAYELKFTTLLRRLAKNLGIPENEITNYHLDASYLDDHELAFLKSRSSHKQFCEERDTPEEDVGASIQ